MKSIVKFEKHSNPQKHLISEIFEKHIDFFFGKSEKHSDLLCSRTLWATVVIFCVGSTAERSNAVI